MHLRSGEEVAPNASGAPGQLTRSQSCSSRIQIGFAGALATTATTYHHSRTTRAVQRLKVEGTRDSTVFEYDLKGTQDNVGAQGLSNVKSASCEGHTHCFPIYVTWITTLINQTGPILLNYPCIP